MGSARRSSSARKAPLGLLGFTLLLVLGSAFVGVRELSLLGQSQPPDYPNGIYYPQENDIIRVGDIVSLVGTSKESTYYLYVSPGYTPSSWGTAGLTPPVGSQKVTNASLGTWNTTGLSSGFYSLKLIVKGKEYIRHVYLSTALAPGWPQSLPVRPITTADDNARWLEDMRSVSVANIDRSGPQEIVVSYRPSATSKSYLRAYNANGTTKWDRELTAGEPVADAPTIEDINKDGLLDSIVGVGFSNQPYSIHAVNGDGQNTPGWPVAVTARPRGISVADLDRDGNMEILVFQQGTMTVLRHDGLLKHTFTVPTCTDGITRPSHRPMPPAVGNLDADPELEYVIPWCKQLAAYNHDGTLVQGWPSDAMTDAPVSPPIILPFGAGNVVAAAAYRTGVQTLPGGIFLFGGNGRLVTSLLRTQSFSTAPIAADMNADGIPELVVGGWQGGFGAGNIDRSNMLSVVGINGNVLWSVRPLYDPPPGTVFQPVVADVSGDAQPDVLIALGGMDPYVADTQGTNVSRLGGIIAYDGRTGAEIDLNPDPAIKPLLAEGASVAYYEPNVVYPAMIRAAKDVVVTDLDGNGSTELVVPSQLDMGHVRMQSGNQTIVRSYQKERGSFAVYTLPTRFLAPWGMFQGGVAHRGCLGCEGGAWADLAVRLDSVTGNPPARNGFVRIRQTATGVNGSLPSSVSLIGSFSSGLTFVPDQSDTRCSLLLPETRTIICRNILLGQSVSITLGMSNLFLSGPNLYTVSVAGRPADNDPVPQNNTKEVFIRGQFAACSNGVEDDGDGLTDFPADTQCTSAEHNNEYSTLPACSDGLDNDGDGNKDMRDPGCESPQDPDEWGRGEDKINLCMDGLDNDGDGLIDYGFTSIADPQCTSGWDESEALEGYQKPQCGNGQDDDGDDLVDGNDPQCTAPRDNDERDGGPVPQCSDARDNDGDGFIDYPRDPDCTGDSDNDEGGAPQSSTASAASSASSAAPSSVSNASSARNGQQSSTSSVRPDLEVTFGPGFAGSTIRMGQEFSVPVVLKNLGNAATSSILMYAPGTLDPQNTTGERYLMLSISTGTCSQRAASILCELPTSLAAGAEMTVSLRYLRRNTPADCDGTNRGFPFAVSGYTANEPSPLTINNLASTELKLDCSGVSSASSQSSRSAASGPDLQVTFGRGFPGSTLRVGQEFTVPLVVKNIGAGPTTTPLALFAPGSLDPQNTNGLFYILRSISVGSCTQQQTGLLCSIPQSLQPGQEFTLNVRYLLRNEPSLCGSQPQLFGMQVYTGGEDNGRMGDNAAITSVGFACDASSASAGGGGSNSSFSAVSGQSSSSKAGRDLGVTIVNPSATHNRVTVPLEIVNNSPEIVRDIMVTLKVPDRAEFIAQGTSNNCYRAPSRNGEWADAFCFIQALNPGETSYRTLMLSHNYQCEKPIRLVAHMGTWWRHWQDSNEANDKDIEEVSYPCPSSASSSTKSSVSSSVRSSSLPASSVASIASSSRPAASSAQSSVVTTLHCSDGKDNDGDTKVDFQRDPGCFSAQDNDERDVLFNSLHVEWETRPPTTVNRNGNISFAATVFNNTGYDLNDIDYFVQVPNNATLIGGQTHNSCRLSFNPSTNLTHIICSIGKLNKFKSSDPKRVTIRIASCGGDIPFQWEVPGSLSGQNSYLGSKTSIENTRLLCF